MATEKNPHFVLAFITDGLLRSAAMPLTMVLLARGRLEDNSSLQITYLQRPTLKAVDINTENTSFLPKNADDALVLYYSFYARQLMVRFGKHTRAVTPPNTASAVTINLEFETVAKEIILLAAYSEEAINALLTEQEQKINNKS